MVGLCETISTVKLCIKCYWERERGMHLPNMKKKKSLEGLLPSFYFSDKNAGIVTSWKQ